jgi:hypothetical protein
MMMRPEAREFVGDIMAVIVPVIEPRVNLSAVCNLCTCGGRPRNFWGEATLLGDNPVSSKIPLDLHFYVIHNDFTPVRTTNRG